MRKKFSCEIATALTVIPMRKVAKNEFVKKNEFATKNPKKQKMSESTKPATFENANDVRHFFCVSSTWIGPARPHHEHVTLGRIHRLYADLCDKDNQPPAKKHGGFGQRGKGEGEKKEREEGEHSNSFQFQIPTVDCFHEPRQSL